MKKYRTANDQARWYGYGGAYSDQCYLYIFDSADVQQSGFVELQTPKLSLFGQSHLPVKYCGCYKIIWNGNGYSDAEFTFIAT